MKLLLFLGFLLFSSCSGNTIGEQKEDDFYRGFIEGCFQMITTVRDHNGVLTPPDVKPSIYYSCIMLYQRMYLPPEKPKKGQIGKKGMVRRV